MGCVYLAISKTSKKVYVGQTIKSLKHRKEEHRHDSKRFNYHFYRAIKKYGWEDFDWITIYESDDDEKLKKREITAIVIYDSYKNGYNDTLGGDGPTKGRKLSEEHKRKISEAHKGMRHTEESKKKISEGHKGINQTEEHKKKNIRTNSKA